MMDDESTLTMLAHYSPRMAANMRKDMRDRALLARVAADPEALLTEPCGPALERVDVATHWALALWFVGLSDRVTAEWSKNFAAQVGGEVGARLARAVKVCRACGATWPAGEVQVAEFVRRLPDWGLTMPSPPPEAAASASPSGLHDQEPPPAEAAETTAERATRRLREFLALGGAVSVSGGVAVLEGKQGALQKLADRERAAGRKRSDRSDIGKELKAEALRQHASPA